MAHINIFKNKIKIELVRSLDKIRDKSIEYQRKKDRIYQAVG